MYMITNYCNLHTFLITKNLSWQKAKWWEKLSNLDLKIEYRPGKYNPANRPFQYSNYIDNKSMYIVGYVTKNLIKA